MTDEEKAAFQKLFEKHSGNATALAEALHRENLDYRRKNATLRTKLEEAGKKAAPDGAVVLTAEQGKAWEAYQKLGAPDDLRKTLETSADLQGRLAKADREKLIHQAAEAHGYKPSVLGRLIGELPIELKDAQKDGKTVKVAHVRDGDASKPLGEYAEASWAEFLPALKATAPAQGTQFPGSAGQGPASKPQSLVAQTLARNKAAAEAPNALKPAAPAAK